MVEQGVFQFKDVQDRLFPRLSLSKTVSFYLFSPLEGHLVQQKTLLHISPAGVASSQVTTKAWLPPIFEGEYLRGAISTEDLFESCWYLHV